MAHGMIVKVSDYIVSPLAMGTHANYECVKAGKTVLRSYADKWNLPEPFTASMVDEHLLEEACLDMGLSSASYTKFERMALLSTARALQGAGIKADDRRVLFIIASTKGNVELLDKRFSSSFQERLLLTDTARCISEWFGNPNEPLVVCNACISGLHAQLEAFRALDSGDYDYVVVTGIDVLSPFIVSGFQSFKAMSNDLCRPFDEERCGLNLGEAAACIVYGCAKPDMDLSNVWCAVKGVIRNDGYHISNPSKTAEGAYRSLLAVLDGEDVSDVAFINVHGTATLFNDEMEATAIDRMGLNTLPVNGLKGYFGHTLGASGVLETLISMEALDDETVLATKGFEHIGVSRKIDISDVHRKAHGRAFVKMMAGFGGCNGVMLFRKGGGLSSECRGRYRSSVSKTHTVHLTERSVVVDGKSIPFEGEGMAMLKSLYHTYVGDYPKFHKMDPLCKLGFIASELLLNAEAENEGIVRYADREDRAVVFVGRSASLCADKAYQQTIQHPDDFYPSPSAFIYTLPNIVTGEIAIRNHYHGETSFLLQCSPENTEYFLEQALRSEGTRSVMGGWIEINSCDSFEAILYIIQ